MTSSTASQTSAPESSPTARAGGALSHGAPGDPGTSDVLSETAGAPPTSAGDVVVAGSRIRFAGQAWRVERLVRGQGKLLFALVGEDSSWRTCIAADGSDGGWELLPPAAARDSDLARMGEVDMPGETRPEPAVTLAPSAAAAAEEASSHGGPGDPGTGLRVSPCETAGVSSAVMSSPVDDWRFPRRPWRP